MIHFINTFNASVNQLFEIIKPKYRYILYRNILFINKLEVVEKIYILEIIHTHMIV